MEKRKARTIKATDAEWNEILKFAKSIQSPDDCNKVYVFFFKESDEYLLAQKYCYLMNRSDSGSKDTDWIATEALGVSPYAYLRERVRQLEYEYFCKEE